MPFDLDFGEVVDNLDSLQPPRPEDDPRWERWMDGGHYILIENVHFRKSMVAFKQELTRRAQENDLNVYYKHKGTKIGICFYPITMTYEQYMTGGSTNASVNGKGGPAAIS